MVGLDRGRTGHHRRRRGGPAVAGVDVVINTAAWTDVDGAETNENAATEVNGLGVAHLARACAAARARLLHVSTDYVFPGDATSPYRENADTKPINAYGRGKLVGEEAVLRALPETGYVVRTAWLYGEHGKNFVATMLRVAATRDTVDVADDQRGQPPPPPHLVVRAGQAPGRTRRNGTRGKAPAGVYHGTASGETTWFGLARATCSARSAWIPSGYGRSPATRMSSRHGGPATACSARSGGPKRVSVRWPRGRSRCPRRCPAPSFAELRPAGNTPVTGRSVVPGPLVDPS